VVYSFLTVSATTSESSVRCLSDININIMAVTYVGNLEALDVVADWQVTCDVARRMSRDLGEQQQLQQAHY